MKAHLTLGEHGGLIAQLETGERIVANSINMVVQLHLAGVTAESLTVSDWKTDLDHAPMSGQIIAIKAALRKYTANIMIGDCLFTKIDELHYPSFSVPVWKVADDTPNAYIGKIVREEDMPDDLRVEFDCSQFGSTMPFMNTIYLHDFLAFMANKEL